MASHGTRLFGAGIGVPLVVALVGTMRARTGLEVLLVAPSSNPRSTQLGLGIPMEELLHKI